MNASGVFFANLAWNGTHIHTDLQTVKGICRSVAGRWRQLWDGGLDELDDFVLFVDHDRHTFARRDILKQVRFCVFQEDRLIE